MGSSSLESPGVFPEQTQVLIVGGGPCGLMLANELGRRGIATVVLDQKPGTVFNPQANATQARTMELYRRLGFADEIRALGLPTDFRPTSPISRASRATSSRGSGCRRRAKRGRW